LEFEWDEKKSARTKADPSRNFAFEYAATIFFDEQRIEARGRVVAGEERWSAIGKAAFGDILFVVYTWRRYGNKEVCRIISARKANKKERSRYSGLR